VDPHSHRTQRHHVYDFTVQKSFLETRRKLNLPEYASPHALRHAFATHLTQDMLLKGFPREMIEIKLIEYLGHASRETLKFYVHLASPKEDTIILPIDTMNKSRLLKVEN
jgi:site-specific recombinase XerD